MTLHGHTRIELTDVHTGAVEVVESDNLITNAVSDIFNGYGGSLNKAMLLWRGDTGYTGAPRGRANCIDIGTCVRQKMGIPRGERYELCRSVHAEANAIISASRRDMVGSTLYLVGRDGRTGALLGDATSCAMCRRQVINAGISKVVIRKTETEFEVVDVQDWVQQEDDVPAL